MKKNLKQELAWYRTRAAQLQDQVDKLEQALSLHDGAAAQLHQAADALLCQVALVYGQPVKDEETGEELGMRLTLPLYHATELLGRYQVRARKDADAYVIGVVESTEEPCGEIGCGEI